MARTIKPAKSNVQNVRQSLFRRRGEEFTTPYRALFYAFRFVWMTIEEFLRNRCTQKSAALAFTSVLSLFPLMAVISICATFFYPGGPNEAENLVVQLMGQYMLPGEPVSAPASQSFLLPAGASQPASSQTEDADSEPASMSSALPLSSAGPMESLEAAIRQSFRQFRRNATRIAGLGSVGLLIVSISLFTACEIFFNQIWKVQLRRPLLKRFSAFSAVIVSLPILITVGTLVTHLFKRQLELLVGATQVGPFVLWFATFAAVASPLLFVAMALTLGIKFIPNTRVNWLPALCGATVTALLWLLAKHVFLTIIGMGVLRRSIFEAFGATLVFLVWLYFLWVIILLGVQIAYLIQNFSVVLREEFRPDKEVLRDPRLYVLVLGRIAEAFLHNEGGLRFDELLKRTSLSESELEEIVDQLQKEHLVAVREDDRLILDRPLENLKLNELFSMACCGSALAGPAAQEDNGDPIRAALKQMDELLPEHFGQLTLKEILRPAE